MKDTEKTARTRRQRGYQWEDTVTKRFNEIPNWKAFRLGSPSIALPDVLAVNHVESIIYAIECKSSSTNQTIVPFDQIERCKEWIDTFGNFKTKQVLLAIKFMSKKRIGKGKYENRQLREYFKIWGRDTIPTTTIIRYEGYTDLKFAESKMAILLEECKMPFKTKQRNHA